MENTMKARSFEDKVNAGFYKTRSYEDFAKDARSWLRERVPHRVVSKLFSMACPDPTLEAVEMLHSLKKFCELFEPVKVVLAIDDRDDRIYYASCPEIFGDEAKPETGWTYEEALGSMIKRFPERFGFLLETKGRVRMETKQ